MFELSDNVMVLDEPIVGKVVSLSADWVSICTEEGVVLEYHETQLLKVPSSQSLDYTSNFNTFKNQNSGIKKTKSKGLIKRKKKEIPCLEIDLHADKLLKNPKVLSPFDILNLQLEKAKFHIESAIAKRIPRIVFIHGVGEGVLKAELNTLFRRYDNIKASEADFKIYGRGATEVYFIQNVKSF